MEQYFYTNVSKQGSVYHTLWKVKLLQSYKFRLWENSKFVSKQLDKIGLTLSTTLVNAGLTSFERLRNTNPRELELVKICVLYKRKCIIDLVSDYE